MVMFKWAPAEVSGPKSVPPMVKADPFLPDIYHPKLQLCSKAGVGVGVGEGTRREDAGVTSLPSVTSRYML